MLSERDICTAVLKFNKQGDMAKFLNTSIYSFRKAASAFRIPLPDGRKYDQKSRAVKKRNIKIMEMRKGGATFLKIGMKFGITKVRAGQIIKEHAPKLSGHIFGHRKITFVKYICKFCKEEKLIRSGNLKQRKYCSHKCRAKDQDGGKGKLAYELRLVKYSWRAIGKLLWDFSAKDTRASARAAEAVASYLKREGINGARAYGFDARGRKSGLIRKIKEI